MEQTYHWSKQAGKLSLAELAAMLSYELGDRLSDARKSKERADDEMKAFWSVAVRDVETAVKSHIVTLQTIGFRTSSKDMRDELYRCAATLKGMTQ